MKRMIRFFLFACLPWIGGYVRAEPVARPTPSFIFASARALQSLAYDENQRSIAYDDVPNIAFGYDRIAVLLTIENQRTSTSTRVFSVDLAEFPAAKSGVNAAEGLATQPNRIYSARELIRRAEERGPFHNFPESFNQQIFDQGTRTVTPNFYSVARPGLGNDAVMYRLPGSVNGANGMFEIGVRPSVSGNTEVIMHRFFNPNP